jgi:hypothetical protein
MRKDKNSFEISEVWGTFPHPSLYKFMSLQSEISPFNANFHNNNIHPNQNT